MVRHIESFRRLGASDRTERNFPVEKLGVARLDQLFQREVSELGAVPVLHLGEQTLIEAGIDLTNPWRSGKMGKAARREDSHSLRSFISYLTDELAELVATAWCGQRVNPRINKYGEDG